LQVRCLSDAGLLPPHVNLPALFSVTLPAYLVPTPEPEPGAASGGANEEAAATDGVAAPAGGDGAPADAEGAEGAEGAEAVVAAARGLLCNLNFKAHQTR